MRKTHKASTSSSAPHPGVLAARRCKACEGGIAALTRSEAQGLQSLIHAQWQLGDKAKSLQRSFSFKDFYRTMSFVNAIAHIANIEDHHPDLEVGYNYCRVRFTTHAIKGLSENDFICAAKIDIVSLT
jgi:4a-hydroxytetrahydrobiopterin dehydratase